MLLNVLSIFMCFINIFNFILKRNKISKKIVYKIVLALTKLWLYSFIIVKKINYAVR